MMIRAAIIFCTVLATASCSVPKLETSACTDAKLSAKEFYSQHFAGDMKNSPDNAQVRLKFLTGEMVAAASAAPAQTDFFTTGDEDFPKAFRIGGCDPIDAGRVRVEVLLFWKTDTRSEQRSINVEMINDSHGWKIDKINR